VAQALITLREATVAHADGLPPVLHDVSLTIARGDWVAVAGTNGSGKSTLLAALAGVLAPRAGRIERAEGLRVALLLQEPDNQLVATSVGRELALSVPLAVTEPERRKRIDAAIERFELGAVLERNPHRLSGGEKQRLALASVWLESPDVLLLDEPLSFLDAEMRARAISFVRELNAGGAAIVWATPGEDDLALAGRSVVLSDGRVRDRAAAAGIARTGGPRRERRDEHRPAEAGASARVRFDAVSFSFGEKRVLDAVDLDVRPGECVGVTGRNGSGKSTLLLLAGGALQPSAGRVVRSSAENGVLYLPQSPERLFFAESVVEEVMFGLERRGIARDAARERARAALASASLDPALFAARSPFEISFGEMRRVSFAIAFALEPELLLLDEPASCLDDEGTEVLDELVRSAAGRGAAVMLATHEEAGASPCGRIVRLDRGCADIQPARSTAVDAGEQPG
jgi:energy-coupling factor transport system ATP-binding protein